MARYVFKRILMMIPVLLGISFVIFTIMSLSPGDPVMFLLGEDPDPQAYEELIREMGLDKPFFVQYLNYM